MDEQITSSDALNYHAIKDNLPAVCETITQVIYNHNLNVLAASDLDRGSKHGSTRSEQDFEPEEVAREFFLLKQIVLQELEPQLLKTSVAAALEQINLVDIAINKVMENCFSSYAKKRKQRIESLHQQILLTNQEINRVIAEHQDIYDYLVHEIKNPLTSIIGYSDLYLRQQRTDNVSNDNLEHIQQVLHQGRNILRLINDTVELSAYQQGNFKLRAQNIDVCVLLEDVIISLKPSIDAKQLRLITSCDPQQLMIRSDALRLQQIITNLLSNSIRYTVEGTINLTCRLVKSDRAEYLEIKITDTGVGIPPQDCARIFEPYFRSNVSQANVPDGIGLGLAIVSQLVNVLGGEIQLSSQINVGSTFVVKIPAATVPE